MIRFHSDDSGPPKKYCIPDERVRKGSEQNVPYHEYCNRSQVAKKIWNSGLKINFKFSWDLRIKMWFPAEDFETRNNKRNNSVSLHVWNMKNGYLSMWACLNEYWNDIWNVDAFVFTVIEMIWGNRIKKIGSIERKKAGRISFWYLHFIILSVFSCRIPRQSEYTGSNGNVWIYEQSWS